MRIAWTLLVLIAALINLAPVTGAWSAERMSALYGVNLDDPSLQVLMRHRAVLFGIVGSLLLAALFHRPFRLTSYVVGLVSMVSFLVIVWDVGDNSSAIRRIVIADLVGIGALALAAFLHFRWLRGSNM